MSKTKISILKTGLKNLLVFYSINEYGCRLFPENFLVPAVSLKPGKQRKEGVKAYDSKEGEMNRPVYFAFNIGYSS